MKGSRTARAVLRPLGLLYSAGMRLRTISYEAGFLRTRRLPGAVISVGNLTVGGTGKTPMVLWIAERLIAEGHRPAILTRGYRGFGNNKNSNHIPDEVGLLRSRFDGRAEFGVGKNRYDNGLALSKNGAKWFILDDGFQHLELERDADIVLLDGTDPFGGGAILPAGRLREPSSALSRADIVVITRVIDAAPALETIVRRFTRAPIFYAQTQFDGIARVPAMSELPESESREGKIFAFCGIGNPAAFFSDLKDWGFSVSGKRSFADHHRYSQAEICDLEATAMAAGAGGLLCTEKDAFNLPDSVAFTLPIYACRIRLALNDEDGFWKAVRAAIGQCQPVTQA